MAELATADKFGEWEKEQMLTENGTVKWKKRH